MRTSISFAKSSSLVLTASLLFAPSVLAAEAAKVQTSDTAATSAATPPATSPERDLPKAHDEASPVGGPAKMAVPSASQEPAPDPASITEVGFQRLPGSAYPEPYTRGLPYGSLSLTFHGLQWPYMPSRQGAPRFVVGLSGWGWIDTSYEKFAPWGENTKLEKSRQKYWIQQARFVTRVTPTYSLGGDWFVQGQAEFVATEDQTIDRSKTGGADTDDLWLRIGQWNKWDFMIGRYEGWEVFHLGMGLDLNTFERNGAYGQGDTYNPVFYGVTDNQYRPQGAAGNVAFHYYPLPYLRFELLSTVGSLGAYPTYSTRPVAVFDIGWLKLKAATEYTKSVSVNPSNDRTDATQKGIGGAIQFVFLPHIEFGLNAAQGTVWNVDSTGKLIQDGSFTRTSLGGFANISNGSPKHPIIFGLGSVYTSYEDQRDQHNIGVVDTYWQLQNFIAVQYVAFQQLYIKLVGGYARGHWSTSDPYSYNDEVYSLRLRLAFYF